MIAALQHFSLRFWCAAPSNWLKARGVTRMMEPLVGKPPTVGDTTAFGATAAQGIATSERHDKAFRTLQARFALIGYELTSSDPSNGSASFYAICRGAGQWLGNLDEARAYLEQIGGNHG